MHAVKWLLQAESVIIRV